MTLEELKALSDREIEQVIAWGQAELEERAQKRRAETIAKIRQLAGQAGVKVVIGTKGRTGKAERRRSERRLRSKPQ